MTSMPSRPKLITCRALSTTRVGPLPTILRAGAGPSRRPSEASTITFEAQIARFCSSYRPSPGPFCDGVISHRPGSRRSDSREPTCFASRCSSRYLLVRSISYSSLSHARHCNHRLVTFSEVSAESWPAHHAVSLRRAITTLVGLAELPGCCHAVAALPPPTHDLHVLCCRLLEEARL